MKKLLLTSAGLENPKIGEEFLKLVYKPAPKIKILFIPTAARTNEELYYVGKAKKELLEIGIKNEIILIYNLDGDIGNAKLEHIDVIYVCGGNTFYLLHRVREDNFGEKIREMVHKGIVYVGASAGSILAGPNIEISGRDKNDVELKEFTGLNLTDKIISPHYTDEEEDIINEFEQETGRKIIRLTDKQALLVTDSNIKVVE